LKADKLIYAPNGAVFVKKCVSIGLLPILLSELLETRVMVKNSMKKYKKNQVNSVWIKFYP
jgi:DNA polymerase zeta